MPRLFTGLEIPEDVAMSLNLMRGGIFGARWIDPENYHITLRFMGDIPDMVASELAERLADVKVRPFDIRMKGLGFFGGNQPHTLYASVEDSPELRRLHSAHERVCQTIGLAPDGRRFTPHVTLARLRESNPADVFKYLGDHNLFYSRNFTIEEFVLFSSRPSRGGGPYAIEESYNFSMMVQG